MTEMDASAAVYEAVTTWHIGRASDAQKRVVLWLVEQGYKV